MSSNYFLLIQGDLEVIAQIESSFGSEAIERLQVSEVKGLSGTPIEWIAFGTVALSALTQVLDLLVTILETKKSVEVIKIGDVEIRNPSKETVAKLLNDLTASQLGKTWPPVSIETENESKSLDQSEDTGSSSEGP